VKPLLSIVIPTKNRYETLMLVINYLLQNIPSNDLEIVIQDNSDSNNHFLNYLSKIKDRRLKYFYNPDSLSVIENSDLSIKNSTGEYVSFIGDDDSVMPYLVDLTIWMKKNNYAILKANKPVYNWKGQKKSYLSNDDSGSLILKKFNYKIKHRSTREGIKHTLKKGGTSMAKLPCLYHGIVKRQLLNLIYIKSNTYFPGPSPDMSNGIAISLFSDSFIYVDFPVFISGKSSKSTGGQGILHKHVSKIDEVKHLPVNTSKKWSEKIPKYWTGPTIWAESTIKALESLEKFDYIDKFRYSYLYAAIYVFNFKNRNEIFDNFKKNIFGFYFFIDIINIFFFRLKHFINNRLLISDISHISQVETLENAMEILNKMVDLKKLPN